MKKKMQIPTIRLVFDRKHTSTTSQAPIRKKGIVQIEIYWNRKRKYISTGVSVYSDQWAENKEMHVVSCVNSVKYNNILSNAVNSIIEKISSHSAGGNYDFLFSDNINIEQELMFDDVCEEYIQKKTLAENTLRSYRLYLKDIRLYGKFGKISSITQSDILSFDSFMNHNIKLSSSSRRLHMAFIKCVIRYAISVGYCNNTSLLLLKLPSLNNTTRQYLTETQLNKLQETVVPKELQRAKDYFLFQCYTGLSYADLSTLTKDMFVYNEQQWFLCRSRKKTHVAYRIMLLKPALEIATKYNFEFDVIIQQTYSRHLNKIGKLINYKHSLSSHIGRHTFATWALSNGVPIEIVSKMLGHTNIGTTQIYAKILAKDVEEQFKKLDKLF